MQQSTWFSGDESAADLSPDSRERIWPSRSVGNRWDLAEVLSMVVGKGNFRIEMRNSIYRVIVTDPQVDMQKVDEVHDMLLRQPLPLLEITHPHEGRSINVANAGKL
jgi:hypothetical protein